MGAGARFPGWLSHREAEVAAGVITGKTNNEVAKSLFVTEKTVKFHLTNIYKKLQVKSRGEMIAGWYQDRLQAAGLESITYHCPMLAAAKIPKPLPEVPEEPIEAQPTIKELPQGA